MSEARFLAAKVIQAVSDGQSLANCLENRLSTLKDPRDRAFVQAVVYGVCRFYFRLDVILSQLLVKPMREKDSDVHALLLAGLYQLIYMRIPEHAVVAETVNAAQLLKKAWARGFINAILREYLRKSARIIATIDEKEEARYAHPLWLIEKIKKAWPQHFEAILTANNAHPPLSLRVNQKQLTREAYLRQLPEAKAIPETTSGIILDTKLPIEKIPGFQTGEISVQDGAAQFAAPCLMPKPSERILDACAAPGGKLLHLLEMEPSLTCVAIEKDPNRLVRIRENLMRTNLSATLICADAKDVDTWWDGQLFDRILLDAPCSASGVIRRHPDIKLLRQPNDISALTEEQSMLLDALWPLLKPAGVLLYVTCSIFPEENQVLLANFLRNHPEACEDKINATWGHPVAIGRQILPGDGNMDGFYYARLLKKP